MSKLYRAVSPDRCTGKESMQRAMRRDKSCLASTIGRLQIRVFKQPPYEGLARVNVCYSIGRHYLFKAIKVTYII